VLVIPGGGVVVARGKLVIPLEKISCSVPPKDWYVLRTGTMGPSCTPLAPDGRWMITRLTRVLTLLLGWKVIV
jgi:hypothetical protein